MQGPLSGPQIQWSVSLEPHIREAPRAQVHVNLEAETGAVQTQPGTPGATSGWRAGGIPSYSLPGQCGPANLDFWILASRTVRE